MISLKAWMYYRLHDELIIVASRHRLAMRRQRKAADKYKQLLCHNPDNSYSIFIVLGCHTSKIINDETSASLFPLNSIEVEISVFCSIGTLNTTCNKKVRLSMHFRLLFLILCKKLIINFIQLPICLAVSQCTVLYLL